MVNTTLPLLLKTRKLWLLFRPGQCPEPLLILQIFKSTGTRELGHCIDTPEQLGISFSCMHSHAKHGNERKGWYGLQGVPTVKSDLKRHGEGLARWLPVMALQITRIMVCKQRDRPG